MDALLTSLVAAFLGEWGDKTQLIVALLAARYGRSATILAGLLLAALASSVVAAIAGALIAETITIRALSLLVALSLLFAGAAGLIRRRPPDRLGELPLIASAFILCLAAEIGDRSQFFTFTLAARFDSAPLAAAGSTAGILAACVPAACLATARHRRADARDPLSAAGLFLVVGFIVAVKALQSPDLSQLRRAIEIAHRCEISPSSSTRSSTRARAPPS